MLFLYFYFFLLFFHGLIDLQSDEPAGETACRNKRCRGHFSGAIIFMVGVFVILSCSLFFSNFH